MNMQSLMKQAQAMQKKMLDAKVKIDKKEFVGKSSVVTVKINGKREVLSIDISDDFDLNDKEILQDMILVAMNDALRQIDKEINDNLGNQAGPLGNLF